MCAGVPYRNTPAYTSWQTSTYGSCVRSKSYTSLFAQLSEFAAANGLVFISDLTLPRVRSFRESWTNLGYAAARKLGYLREFLRFCVDSKWVTENYAVKLKPPKIGTPASRSSIANVCR